MTQPPNPYFDGDFTPLRQLLKTALRSCLPDAGPDFLRLGEVWDAIAGESLSHDAQPAALKNGILIVHVTSSSWIYHLQFLKTELIGKLNAKLGRPMIKDIKFKVGQVLRH